MAMQAWNRLSGYYDPTTLHNRVMIAHRLHEFELENGRRCPNIWTISLVVGMQTLGEPFNEARRLVNGNDVKLKNVKETLMRAYGYLEKNETAEFVFKVNVGRFKGGWAYGRK
ncbi:LOW QUALITY PROTEIN: polyprotein [Phytophthora megakarya]|uniref:Polyprotein n=1 Tax=Phytophthora megakarya TaxID=4795 RepID=A0A225WHB1_9STRA|nr:LOW QUALITY PROTEIN: polyprotein [Phytophthora megakarya]